MSSVTTRYGENSVTETTTGTPTSMIDTVPILLDPASATAFEEQIVIPVVEEELLLSKRIVESGGVRVVKTVTTREEDVNQSLLRESAVVDRVAVNRLLAADEALPKPRQEGDTMIVPLFEEVLVVEKRIRVTEELHIRLSKESVAAPSQTVTLRREEVRVEAIPAGQEDGRY